MKTLWVFSILVLVWAVLFVQLPSGRHPALWVGQGVDGEYCVRNISPEPVNVVVKARCSPGVEVADIPSFALEPHEAQVISPEVSWSDNTTLTGEYWLDFDWEKV
jgi:hypothetical protein